MDNLSNALEVWNEKQTEIWSLLTASPQSFRGGRVWSVMELLHGTMLGIGYGLLVLFFAIGVVKSCGSFIEAKRPEQALRLFVRFALSKAAVTYGLELMLAALSVTQGMVSTVMNRSGVAGLPQMTLSPELVALIENCGFWDSIPLWAVTLIGSLLVTVLSFTMILTVYGRIFNLFLYAAIAPVPLATFAGQTTSAVGKSFVRSYAGVCLQGVTIAIACIIFSVMATNAPVLDTNMSPVSAVWSYLGSMVFNLLILVGAIKGCDRVTKEMLGL